MGTPRKPGSFIPYRLFRFREGYRPNNYDTQVFSGKPIRCKRSRWTLDLVHARDAVPVANTGAGLLALSDSQTVVRLQYQFIF